MELLPENLPLKPCRHCTAPAQLCREETDRRWFYVGCSNLDFCAVWPVTHAHETAVQACDAWHEDRTV